MSDETLDCYLGPYLAVAHLYVFICRSVRKWTAESHCRFKLPLQKKIQVFWDVMWGISLHSEGSVIFRSTHCWQSYMPVQSSDV